MRCIGKKRHESAALSSSAAKSTNCFWLKVNDSDGSPPHLFKFSFDKHTGQANFAETNDGERG